VLHRGCVTTHRVEGVGDVQPWCSMSRAQGHMWASMRDGGCNKGATDVDHEEHSIGLGVLGVGSYNTASL
jgi:hypothetical protein